MSGQLWSRCLSVWMGKSQRILVWSFLTTFSGSTHQSLLCSRSYSAYMALYTIEVTLLCFSVYSVPDVQWDFLETPLHLLDSSPSGIWVYHLHISSLYMMAGLLCHWCNKELKCTQEQNLGAHLSWLDTFESSFPPEQHMVVCPWESPVFS